MLRLLVLALVLANLVLLGLQLLDRPDGAPSEAGTSRSGAEAAPGITLLSEAGDELTGGRGTAECFAVGPFATEPERREALEEIAPIAVAIGQRQTEAEVLKGIWVHLPVQPDYITARSMALTLRDAGFPEANVVREGDWRHSVSLGYFLNDDNAQALLKEARSFGFDARRRPETETQPRYWLDYEQRTGAPYWQPGQSGTILAEQHRAIPCARSDGG